MRTSLRLEVAAEHLGAELIPDPKRHEAKADFSSGPTGWAMTGLTVDSDLD